VDTVETATTWTNIQAMIGAIETALCAGLADLEERVHVFTHLSHVYPEGASVYTTYLFRLSSDPDESFGRWARLKKAASLAIVGCHGTISHQHGVGVDHMPYLEAEKGALGMATIRALAGLFDPQGIMNPGKLVLPAPGHESS
jgi:alkyldihydroxyacetonephosphate synthase